MTWRSITSLEECDLLDQQLDARVSGLRVHEPMTQACRTFDSNGGALGTFRTFGRAAFDKTTRRWQVRPCTGASVIEQANLILFGLKMIRVHGTSPGHGLRTRHWTHSVGSGNGHRYAYSYVARRVDREELLELSLAEELNDLLSLPIKSVDSKAVSVNFNGISRAADAATCEPENCNGLAEVGG